MFNMYGRGSGPEELPEHETTVAGEHAAATDVPEIFAGGDATGEPLREEVIQAITAPELWTDRDVVPVEQPDWDDAPGGGAVAEGVREQSEQVVITERPPVFDIGQFEGQEPTDAETPYIAELMRRELRPVFARHAVFSDLVVTPTYGQSESIELEDYSLGERVDLRIGTAGLGSITAGYVDHGGIPHAHIYYLDAAGVMRRHNVNILAERAGVPAYGMAPTQAILEEIAARWAEDQPNRQMAQDRGLNELPIGVAEAEYVLRCMAQARPRTVSFEALRELARNRLKEGSIAPDFADSAVAGQELELHVRIFLGARGFDSGKELTGNFEGEYKGSKGEYMYVQAGLELDGEDQVVPFMRVQTEQTFTPLQTLERLGKDAYRDGQIISVQHQVDIEYRIIDRRLMTVVDARLLDSKCLDVVKPLHRRAAADMREARLARNFLWSPSS